MRGVNLIHGAGRGMGLSAMPCFIFYGSGSVIVVTGGNTGNDTAQTSVRFF